MRWWRPLSTRTRAHYTDLRERAAYITKVVKVEEENFARTIDGGMKIFADMLAEHKAKGETEFSGADAFKLYDTYGFPIDLTLEMVADEDMTAGPGGLRKAHAGAEGPRPGGPEGIGRSGLGRH